MGKIIKYLSLVIALVALIISAKACCDSNEALKISKRQSMAFIQVVDVKLVQSIDSASFIAVKLNVKNLGQVPARDVKAEFDYGIKIGNFISDGNSTTRCNLGSIGQGFEKTISLKSKRRNFRNWEIKSLKFYDVLYFYGTLFYKDDLTDEEKKVDWCYELPLNQEIALKTLELHQSESDNYISTYKQRSQ